jgi:hypothetical protein
MTTTKNNTKYFYAKSFRFGRNCIDANSGCEISTVYAFRSAADRDAWVDASNVYSHNQAGWREAVLARRCSRSAIADAQMMIDEQYAEREVIYREYRQYHPEETARLISLRTHIS